MKTDGYTLMELMLTISLIAIILIGGTAIFLNGLRSNSIGDMDQKLNTSLRSTLNTFERNIRFGTIISVDSNERNVCLANAEAGVSGTSLIVEDRLGAESEYKIDDAGSKVASISAVSTAKVFISSNDIEVSDISFTWYCRSGVNDKINVQITASAIASGGGVLAPRTMSRQIELINSGIN